MKPTPLWLLPVNFNPSENEGREAYLKGVPVDRNPYGEDCLAATDWQRGWKFEFQKANR